MPFRHRQERTEASHDYRDGSDYIPFETITIVETERPSTPVLYDHHGTPLVRPKPVIGFKNTRSAR